MAGGDGKQDLEQWKKALLSRDFDLVHTQLLMLDGDVTTEERVQLVQEIFTAVEQIEELTIGKRNSDDVQPPKIHVPQHQQGTSRTDAANRQRPRNLSESKEASKSVTCPVCDRTSFISTGRVGVREDWYCNSCRLFKLRLDKKYSLGEPLPTCCHRGAKVNRCKGCRRFKLQSFWLSKRHRTNPYPLPLMSEEEEASA